MLTESMLKHRVRGWLRDLPDHRDYQYAYHPEMLKLPATLPSKVDLRPQLSPIVDQGRVGSCTGNAIAGALEFLELQEMRAHLKPGPQNPEEFDPNTFSGISRLFIYYNERLIEGTTEEDAGAQIRDGIKAVRNYGVCRESVWPYIESQTFSKPSDPAYQEALQHKVLFGYRLNNTFLPMKLCLANGFPFVFGIAVYESFMSSEVAKTGIVPMPQASESALGGHALLCVGYDDHQKVFIVRNSWGTSFGLSGYCLIPYQYLADPDLCADLWTLRRIPA